MWHKIRHTKLTAVLQDPATGGDVHMVILRLCSFASLLFCLIKSLRQENIGRKRRGRRNEQICLSISRFGSAIQQLSAAFSTSLLPSVRGAQKSDWKVSLWACSILGKNLKEKIKNKTNPKPAPWNYGCKMKCVLSIFSVKAELAKQRCSSVSTLIAWSKD